MHKYTRLLLLASAVGLAVILVVGFGMLTASNASSARQAAPIAAPQALPAAGMAAPLPAETCTLSGNVRTCELWATTGTITLSNGITDVVVPIWGYADNEGAAAQLPGPVIVANEGETLEVTLHNRLPGETTSLFFVGQEGILPDTVGVDENLDITYIVELARPGTFIYQAGLTENGARQVAMGMFGGLIVRPTADPASAYGSPGNAFQKEALLIYSEIDPDFNFRPYEFNMQDFKAEYWLINGKSYPQTEWIEAAAGEAVLLRQINAGLEQKSIGLLGIEQTFIAVDGEPLTYPYTMVAESIGTGQTVDTIVQVPLEAITNTVYPLYESSLHQHNGGAHLANGQLAFGGILSFIGVTTGTLPTEAGPLVTSFTVSPDDTNAAGDLTLSGVITARTPGVTVEGYELFIDLPGLEDVTRTEAVSSGSSVNVEVTISSSEMAGWPGGTVIFYLRGVDDRGTLGQWASAVLNFDIVGPEIYGLKLSPNPTNGSKDAHLSGTANDRYTGNEIVTGAGFSFGGVDYPLELNREDAVVVGLSGDIPAAQIAGLSDGEYPVNVWAEDGHGNVDSTAVVMLTVDRTGPAASGVTLTPNYLNFSGALPAVNVRLDAVVTDPVINGVSSTLFKVWAYFDDPNMMFEVFPSDGMFDTDSEAVHFNIPVVNFARLGTGIHEVNVVGQDKAGNMGQPVSATVEVFNPTQDQLGPVLVEGTGMVSPNPTGGANNVQLTAQFSDPSFVYTAEWFVGADPGFGNAQPLGGNFGAEVVDVSAQIHVASWSPGNYTIYVRAMDMKNNWSSTYPIVLQVTRRNRGVILTESFEDPEFSQWDEVVGDVRLVEEAQMPSNTAVRMAAADMGMQASLNGAGPAYVQDNLEGETKYQISFYFDPNSIDLNGGKHQVFTGLNREESGLFGIELREGAAGYLIRGWVLTTEGLKYTPDIGMEDAPHRLEITWNPGEKAILVFSMDNVDFAQPGMAKTESISGVEAAGGELYTVRLGPSAIEGGNQRGAEYFDSINAVRQQLELFLYLPLVNH